MSVKSLEEVVGEIAVSLMDSDDSFITELFNQVCDGPELEYLGDSLWEAKDNEEEDK